MLQTESKNKNREIFWKTMPNRNQTHIRNKLQSPVKIIKADKILILRACNKVLLRTNNTEVLMSHRETNNP